MRWRLPARISVDLEEDRKHNMNSKNLRLLCVSCVLPASAFFAVTAHAQLVVSDSLTGASNSYDWFAQNGACLTAGTNAKGVAGKIPGCNASNFTYYSGKTQVGGVTGRLPDTDGSGALRLTNGDTTLLGNNGDNQTGAVVSVNPFPTNQGLEVTFTTATYGGDGQNLTGADGITFFLADGTKDPSVGGLGGSLGYTCSNTNGSYNGVVGGYIGLGIDEFGNFSNPGDNTNSGPGYFPGRISLRGAGDTAFSSLSAKYPVYYPASLNSTDQAAAVKNTCKTGTVWNYSGATQGGIANKANTNTALAYNYPYISGVQLPIGVSISNQQGINMPKRGSATPITYGLKLTQDGLLSLSYSVNGGAAQSVITNQSITAANGPLPPSFRFGFSAGTGGANNVHEIMCFKAKQINTSASSAGINVQQSAKVQVGTQLYLAYYHPTNWWGQLTAQNLVKDAITDTVSISPVANWDASCTLTGGKCDTTGGNTISGQDWNSQREILTWNNNVGVPFKWNKLSDDQQKSLGDSQDRFQYIRGRRDKEIATAGGTFRTRDSLLGDIVNSSPTWVGYPSLPYTAPWSDKLFPATTAPEGMSYTGFASDNATRTNMVYVGANDGMLHGFRAGAYTSSGAFDTSAPNDGQELLAYVPATALATLYSDTTPALDFSSSQYSHNAFVDATPGSGDLYYAGAWHTWLIGGLGAGGNADGVIGDKTTVGKGAIFALDVTNPNTNFFKESKASQIVLGEWNSDNLSCVGNATCNINLGSTYGTPIVRRLHDGNWAVIFGNGLNSSSGKAGIFIMHVDQGTGTRSFRYLDTGAGPIKTGTTVTARNGIAYVSSADLDDDHVTDYLYAGDVFGNLWRFDLTSANPTSWATATKLVFNTGGLPITTNLTVTAAAPKTGASRVIVSFGTGRILPQTLALEAQPDASAQSLFGIWDWDLSGWNAKSTTQYASLTGTQTFNASNLQAQTATTQSTGSSDGKISGVRTVTQNPICWKGASYCSTNNTQFGWKLALPGAKEQVVYNPIVSDGLFIVNTTLPAIDRKLTCDTQPASGFTMAISPDTGGAPQSSYFSDSDNNVVSYAGAVVAGLGLSGVGSPSIVSSDTKKYLATQTVNGEGSVTQVNPGAATKGGRLTWIKLR